MTIPYWDIEDIIDETITYLKDATNGINAAITAVNSAKAARDTAAGRPAMTLPKFINISGAETLTENENLFFFMIEEINNVDPALLIGIPEWAVDDMGANTVTVTYNLIVEDTSDGTDPKRKLMRYNLALNAVLKDYLNQADLFTASALTNIEPDFQSVLTEDVSRSFYSAGVRMRISFA